MLSKSLTPTSMKLTPSTKAMLKVLATMRGQTRDAVIRDLVTAELARGAEPAQVPAQEVPNGAEPE